METHKVKKVVIITEKLIATQVCELLDKSQASGYTISSVDGKGSRNIRKSSIVENFANVKIEVIVKDQQVALEITEAVVEEFLGKFSGITYIENVEIFRMAKFVIG